MASTRPNILIVIAQANGRTYITPEDVTEARRKHGAHKTRMALLRIFAGLESVGVEDGQCCAFVAMKPRRGKVQP